MQYIDLAIVATFLIVTLGIGLYYGRGVKTIRDYALGGRNFSTVTLAATIIATWIAGSDFMIIMSYSYVDGMFLTFLASMGDVLNLFLVGFVLVPRMREFLGKLSVAEVMGDLYGSNIRFLTAILGIIVSAGWVGSQLIIISSVFVYLHGVESNTALVFTATSLILYSIFGGIKSVTFTDIIQFIVFIVVVPSMGISLWNHLDHGSIHQIGQISWQSVSLVSTTGVDYLSLFIINLVPSLNPTIFHRILLGKNLRQVSSAFYISSIVCLIIFVISSLIGVLLFYYDSTLDQNAVFGFLVDTFLPSGLKGLAIIAVLAMSMSTSDSHLNSASVTFAHDILHPLNFSKKYVLFFSRSFGLVVGVLALFLALNFQNLLELILFANNFYMPIITVPLILAILGFRSSTKSVLIGMMAGFTTVVLWKWQLQSSTGFDSLVPGMLANLIFFIGSHYFLRQPGGWVGSQDQIIPSSVSNSRKKSWSEFKKSSYNLLRALFTLNPKSYDVRINHSTTSYVMLGILILCSYVTIRVSSDAMVLERHPEFMQFASLSISGLLITYSLWSKNLSENNKSSFGFVCILFLLFSSFLMMMTHGFVIPSVMTFVINIIVCAMFVVVANLVGLVMIAVFLSWSYYNYTYGALIVSPEYSSISLLVYCVFALSVIIFAFLRGQQEQIISLENSELNLKHLNVLLNAQIKSREENLEKALDMHADILRNINHEIKTPMSVLMSNADLLIEAQKSPQFNAELPKIIDAIVTSVERFSSYASNLIDLSAYQTDKMLFDIKPGNLRNLLEGYAADNIYLGYPVEVQDKIEFDDLKMRQVFHHIIDNANKYSGGGDIEITVSNAPDIEFDSKSWQAIKIIVKDCGIGIPENELENIFEPFRLSSRTSDGSGGKGLGLALVKAIITAHRGKVLAYNNADKGCSIEIILPIIHPKVKFLGAATSSQEPMIDLKEIITKANEIEAKFHGKIPKILMVDDEKFVLHSAELIIQSLGYDFEAIASGEDAVEYINSDKFDADLIFLDMMLADTTGLQVMGKIADKVRAAGIPIIVQSGLVADDPNIVATIALGAKGFMGKPYKKNDIDQVIKEHLCKG